MEGLGVGKADFSKDLAQLRPLGSLRVPKRCRSGEESRLDWHSTISGPKDEPGPRAPCAEGPRGLRA